MKKAKLRWFLLGIAVAVCATALVAAPRPTRTVKVKIDASMLLRQALLKKLNEHGKRHHLRFEAIDKNYDYRITFAMVQGREHDIPAGYYHKGVVAAYNPTGEELFEFSRGLRWTRAGAINACADEIIERLRRVWKAEAKASH